MTSANRNFGWKLEGKELWGAFEKGGLGKDSWRRAGERALEEFKAETQLGRAG